jgi:tRNA-2-methylthio-N6-dimethylallyladenosine synthase
VRVYLETFGCQMNELDSELVRGHLESLGYRFVPEPEAAEVLLYNTCSVRAAAEQKAYSRIGIVGQRKKSGESLILGVLGCMAERDGLDLFRRYPQVDLLVGPGELDRLPLLLDNLRTTGRGSAAGRAALAGNKNRRSATLAAAEDGLEALDLGRSFQPRSAGDSRSAYVRITRGCNKFCTYCVVPNTRGAEVHRPPDHIVEECRRLVDSGVLEITLLGQTVNHYRYEHGVALTLGGGEAPQIGPGLQAFRNPDRPAGRRVTTFADLLRRIHDEIPALRRLRFVTSYPRDFGEDILAVLRDCPRICRYLHAPAQSGSDRILKLMNRGYTVAEYREFVDRVFRWLPDATLAGDIIVGFPTETDDDFAATVELVRSLPFKNNFIFKYSPRPGTVAIDRFADEVPDEVKRYRNNTLLAVQSEVSARVHAAWVGRTVEVFVESHDADEGPEATNDETTSIASHAGETGTRDRSLPQYRPTSGSATAAPPTRRADRQVVGRTAGDLIVAFDAPIGTNPRDFSGRVVTVELLSSRPLLLGGRLVGS